MYVHDLCDHADAYCGLLVALLAKNKRVYAINSILVPIHFSLVPLPFLMKSV